MLIRLVMCSPTKRILWADSRFANILGTFTRRIRRAAREIRLGGEVLIRVEFGANHSKALAITRYLSRLAVLMPRYARIHVEGISVVESSRSD